MQCKSYVQARISAACRPLMSLLGVHALPVVNALTRSLKSTARSRAVRRILTSKIKFDAAVDSIWIRFIKVGFDSIRIQYSNRFEPYKKPVICQQCLVFGRHISQPGVTCETNAGQTENVCEWVSAVLQLMLCWYTDVDECKPAEACLSCTICNSLPSVPIVVLLCGDQLKGRFNHPLEGLLVL